MISGNAMSSDKESIITQVLKEHVNQKVNYIQSVVKFTDAQAKQLKTLELNYLLDVQKAENCFWCRTKKRVEKLKLNKYKAVEKILSKDEYIKYKAIDNKEIKRHPETAK